MSQDQTVQFTPVEVGDMSEVPPDAPAGKWEAVLEVHKSASKKDGYPQLRLSWQLQKALSDGNESHEGSRVTDWLTFFPKSHPGAKMSIIRMIDLCECLGVKPPSIAKLDTWADLEDFIAEIDGARVILYTTIQVDKETKEARTQIRYKPPRGMR